RFCLWQKRVNPIRSGFGILSYPNCEKSCLYFRPFLGVKQFSLVHFGGFVKRRRGMIFVLENPDVSMFFSCG
ncbi:MAG: hypothetical protein WCW17_04545, partial [Patescibacteria group bacterium]